MIFYLILEKIKTVFIRKKPDRLYWISVHNISTSHPLMVNNNICNQIYILSDLFPFSVRSVSGFGWFWGYKFSLMAADGIIPVQSSRVVKTLLDLLLIFRTASKLNCPLVRFTRLEKFPQFNKDYMYWSVRRFPEGNGGFVCFNSLPVGLASTVIE